MSWKILAKELIFGKFVGLQLASLLKLDSFTPSVTLGTCLKYVLMVVAVSLNKALPTF